MSIEVICVLSISLYGHEFYTFGIRELFSFIPTYHLFEETVIKSIFVWSEWKACGQQQRA